MSSGLANIEKLNEAITTLSDDAIDVHELIISSTDELEKAISIGDSAAKNASKIVDILDPLAKKLDGQLTESSRLLNSFTEEMRSDRADFKKLATKVFKDFDSEHKEQFEKFSAKSLSENQKTRDELQNDFLSHKTATAARLDGLEGEIIKLAQAVESANKESAELLGEVQKKALMPFYAVIVFGLMNLICLMLLLLR